MAIGLAIHEGDRPHEPVGDAEWDSPAARAAIAAGAADAVARAEAAEAAARENDARTGRRVLVHASGFRQSPYADTRPPGVDPRAGRGASPVVVPEAAAAALPSRKLWHASPGSSGH